MSEMSSTGDGAPALTVVLPVYNERENLDALVARLLPVATGAVGDAVEIIFVDDGSSDGSGQMLDALHARDPRLKAIHFSRNFGHQAALQAGLDAASGAAVVLMDADLQDPPEVVAALVGKWREGFDVVYAVRTRRKESIAMRVAYNLFYRTLHALAEIEIPLDAGDFCLMDRKVVDTIVALPERNRFLRGLRSWVGFTHVALPYERDARHAGAPKYTFTKLVKLALSGYVGFSKTPLTLATWLGFLAALGGFALAAWSFGHKVFPMVTPPPKGWTSLMATVMFMGGVQLFMLGVLGEYLGRIYDEVRQRPLYVVGRRVGFGEAPPAAEPPSSVPGRESRARLGDR